MGERQNKWNFPFFILQNYKFVTRFKIYFRIVNCIRIGKSYHGIRKTVLNLQYSGRPDVKVQSNEILAESINFGGDYGKRT
ncbi:hypothetical protein [Methanosarcina sp. UBA5]|uniref:hypothetical protein n=1 Tax=Methanosarcina sp. UBA5 TaxID=1915593 RepID=UPI002600AED8|nr:hypothetical protein [Methanosarcina sp. UBA5]